MKVEVKTIDNRKKGDIELSDGIFAIEPRADIVARVVKWQLAKRRAGTHQVKERSDVSKTGAKMFRQKGTGRARAGNGSVSQFRGGGVVHGPALFVSHGHSLPKKGTQAWVCALFCLPKMAAGQLIILDDAKSDGKTADLTCQTGQAGCNKCAGADRREQWIPVFHELLQISRWWMYCHSRVQMFMIWCAAMCWCFHVTQQITLRSA